MIHSGLEPVHHSSISLTTQSAYINQQHNIFNLIQVVPSKSRLVWTLDRHQNITHTNQRSVNTQPFQAATTEEVAHES